MGTVAAHSVAFMIAKPSIAFNDFSGTAKEVTARNVGGRNVLSVRAKQSKVFTPAQAVSKNNLSSISRAYKQLTDSQMAAWRELAGHLKGISTLGDAASLTAHNAFVRINSNRVLLGESILSDAPDYRHNIPAASVTGLWVTPDMQIFTGITNPGNGEKLVIKMSAGQSAGVSSGWSRTVIVGNGVEDDFGDADMIELYSSVVGYTPKLGEKVFIEFWWVDPATGMCGESCKLSRTCITKEQAIEEGYVRRLQIKLKDVEATERLHSFNLDMSTGCTALTCEAVYSHRQYYSQFYVNTLEGIPDDYDCMFIILGRAGADKKYAPQVMEVLQYALSQSKNSINFKSCGGTMEQNAEVFGTAVAMVYR